MLQDQNLVAWWRRGRNPAELDGLHNQEAPAQAYIHGEPNVLAGMDFDHDNQEQGEGDNQVAGNNNVEEEMEARNGPRTQAHDLWPRRPRNYNHLYAMTTGVALTQMSMKKGLATFREPGKEAVAAKLRQLHERGVMIPLDSEKLSDQQRRRALEYLMFLKKKRCGKIKGVGVQTGVNSEYIQLRKRPAHLPCPPNC
jgi:hypothetical protein